MRITTLLLSMLLCYLANSQKAVSNEITNLLAQGNALQETSLLQFVTNDVSNRSYDIEGLTAGTILRIDEQAIATLMSGENDFIQLTLPTGAREEIKLQLKSHQIFSEDFYVSASDAPGIPMNYKPGIHYRGIVEADPSSLVALSVFDNEVMGIISTSKGNLILGRLEKDRESHHILYNENDLPRKHNFDCGTEDDGLLYTAEELQEQPQGRDVGDCVRVYIEIDDDIVTQKGGATPATNYITGLFNQSIVLYNSESVSMMISEIYAWTTNSPYTGSTSSAMLSSFQANTGEFNGNIGHLVSYQASGGIAVLDNLCSSNPDWRKCFSSIDATFANVPTYSWSVMVITHEMGHVIGSKHTHACVWNGNNTAIDGCAGSTEGSCPVPGNPPEGGTIMSYCHITNLGINFNLGFGPQPGNIIRNRVNATNNCLTSCGPPPPPPPPTYCSSNGSNTNYEWINKVVLGSINNTSGNNQGYADYTSLSTNLTAGASYTINLTPGFASSSYLEYWRVWIDYNGDLDWSDSGEQVGQGTGSSAVNISFTVPSNTSSGTKRMRVSMKYAGYAASCGTFTYGEVEDYNVSISGSGPSCTDGIQNQGETGIDCGGPCQACATCFDGIQNQGETGIDCGGPCSACATCFDGIQNQGETGVDCGGPCTPCGGCSDGIQNQGESGVDCGGPCPACATCFDGVQNQGETGVDCGGPCPACPPPSGDEEVTILASYFETGWDGWNDGGSDATRVNSTNSWEGLWSILLADNSGKASSMTTPNLPLSDAVGVEMEFHFKAVGMESGEDFWVLYKDDSNNWVIIAQAVAGVHFNNNIFYVATVTVPGFVPTNAAKLRIQCDASDDSDQIYVDAVTVTKLTGAALIEESLVIKEIAELKDGSASDADQQTSYELMVYPNPVSDVLHISFDGEIQDMRLMTIDGVQINVGEHLFAEKQLDIQPLAPGLYLLWIQSHGEWYPVKFNKI